KILAQAAQVDAREHHLGSGGTDVDADADQGDVVLLPDGIVLERPQRFEIVVIVVRLLAGQVHMVVIEVAQAVVVQAVPPFGGRVLVVGFLVFNHFSLPFTSSTSFGVRLEVFLNTLGLN